MREVNTEKDGGRVNGLAGYKEFHGKNKKKRGVFMERRIQEQEKGG